MKSGRLSKVSVTTAPSQRSNKVSRHNMRLRKVSAERCHTAQVETFSPPVETEIGRRLVQQDDGHRIEGDSMTDSTSLVTLSEDGTATTTSLVIAEGTENQHKNVLELIRSNRADFEEFGPLAFETRRGQPLPQGGFARSTEVAILNEPQATLLITYMRNNDVVRAFKKRLVHAFYELAAQPTQPALPKSREELLALAVIEAQQMITERDQQIALLAAPAKSWQLLADANGDFSVAEAAKILSRDPAISIGRDRLFQFMAEQKWIFRSRNPRGGWEAYQTAVDVRRLVEKPAKPFLNSKTGEYELPSPTIRVTAKGIGKLHELLGGTDPIRFIAGEESA